MSILDKQIVLLINRNYQIIGTTTPKRAIVAMLSSSDGENLAAKAIAIDYEGNDKDGYNFESPINVRAMHWDEWQNEKIRNFDNYISTTNAKYRIMTVLQAHNYSKIPVKEFRPTAKHIFEKYNNICAYTGQKLTPATKTLDHVIPVSRWKELGKTGSPDNWKNLAPCLKEVNHKKGNKLNSEANLKLIYELSAPKPIPVSELIDCARFRDWQIFSHK